MRISDWSSDVCPSDLKVVPRAYPFHRRDRLGRPVERPCARLLQGGEALLLSGLPRARIRVQRRRARKSVVLGRGVSVRVESGGLSRLKKHKKSDTVTTIGMTW